MYSLSLLGCPTISGPSGPVTGRATQPRRMAVLAVLGCECPDAVTRAKLAGLLWRDVPEESARRALSDVLYDLRQALGEEAVAGAGANLRLNADRVSCDAAIFRRALDEDRPDDAVELYEGPFLDGFYVSGAPAFEKWTDTRRRTFAEEYARALRFLAESAERSGDPVAAARCWRRLASHDPLNSRVALACVRALRAAGDPAGALRHADEHRRRLQSELGMEPSPELEALAEDLRTGSVIPPGSKGSAGRAGDAEGDTEREAPGRPETGTPGSEAGGEAPAPRTPPGPMAEGPSRRRRPEDAEAVARFGRRPWSLAAAVTLLALLATAWLATPSLFDRDAGRASSAASGPVETPRVVMADWRDGVDDPGLVGALRELLRLDLARSPSLRPVDPSAVRSALRRMEEAPGARIGPGLARRVARREGAELVLAGTVHRLGRGYVLTGEVLRARDGERLAAARETAPDSTGMLEAAERLSSELRVDLGEAADAVEREPRLASVTTASLPALRRYTGAVHAFDEGDRERGVALLEEALEFDPDFANAHGFLSAALHNLRWQHTRAMEELRRTYELRDRLPFRERMIRVAQYHRRLTGDLDAAARALRALLDREPEMTIALNVLGNVYDDMRRPERAAALYRRALAVDSTGVEAWSPWANLVLVLVGEGQFDGARRTLREARARVGDHPVLRGLGPYVAAVERDLARAEAGFRSLARAREGDVLLRGRAVRRLGRILATRGRLRAADSALSLAMELHEAGDAPRDYLLDALQGAWMDLMHRDDPARGRRRLRRARERHPLRTLPPVDRPYLEMAEFHAASGDAGGARELLEAESGAVDPSYRSDRREARRALVRGWIALRSGRAERAVRVLLSIPERARSPRCDDLCHLYPLGLALHRAGRPDSARAVLRRYLTEPGRGRFRHDARYLASVRELLAAWAPEGGEPAAARRYDIHPGRLRSATDVVPMIRRGAPATTEADAPAAMRKEGPPGSRAEAPEPPPVVSVVTQEEMKGPQVQEEPRADRHVHGGTVTAEPVESPVPVQSVPAMPVPVQSVVAMPAEPVVASAVSVHAPMPGQGPELMRVEHPEHRPTVCADGVPEAEMVTPDPSDVIAPAQMTEIPAEDVEELLGELVEPVTLVLREAEAIERVSREEGIHHERVSVAPRIPVGGAGGTDLGRGRASGHEDPGQDGQEEGDESRWTPRSVPHGSSVSSVRAGVDPGSGSHHVGNTRRPPRVPARSCRPGPLAGRPRPGR